MQNGIHIKHSFVPQGNAQLFLIKFEGIYSTYLIFCYFH